MEVLVVEEMEVLVVEEMEVLVAVEMAVLVVVEMEAAVVVTEVDGVENAEEKMVYRPTQQQSSVVWESSSHFVFCYNFELSKRVEATGLESKTAPRFTPTSYARRARRYLQTCFSEANFD